KVAWLDSGTAVFVDHPPGQVAVSIGRDKSFAVDLQPGQEYFIEIAALGHTLALGAIPYLMESVANDGLPQDHCGWDWCAGVVPKDPAMTSLRELSISGPNPNAD